jgi:hypothetical protein
LHLRAVLAAVEIAVQVGIDLVPRLEFEGAQERRAVAIARQMLHIGFVVTNTGRLRKPSAGKKLLPMFLR